MKKGYLSFVFHCHLPYVLSHGSWPHGMDWLYEAAAETYIPLLDTFHRLISEGISPRVTVGITPILAEQLADDDFAEGFEAYLNMKIDAALHDQKTFRDYGENRLAALADFWVGKYRNVQKNFLEEYKRNIIGAFRTLQDEDHIEMITSAATHGYLPLIGYDEAVNAQIRLGVETYKRYFGRKPRGLWLPECAYRPSYEWKFPVAGDDEPAKLRKGVVELLAVNGIEYFIVDSSLIRGGQAVGVYLERFKALGNLWKQFEKQYKPRDEDFTKTTYRNYYAGLTAQKGNPVGVFVRDTDTGFQVWSGEYGYPGDGNYLEFHKKHFPGGHRYWKVTGANVDLADKQIYEPEIVTERLRENAGHFKDLVKRLILDARETGDVPPVVCAPFDAELFGHWWHEGPEWLYYMVKWVNADPELATSTLGEYYDSSPPVISVDLPEGSWGKGGFHWIWLNEGTKWTWKHIYEDERIMIRWANSVENPDPHLKEILEQMARELVLLESSDWQFLISTWSARDYAELRFSEHHDNFQALNKIAESCLAGQEIGEGDRTFLDSLMKEDRVFKNIDISWWRSAEKE